jgi:tetratricopeptide (TPR) repeat protein
LRSGDTYIWRVTLTLACFSIAASAQQSASPAQHDSVSVSAGITKDQLQIEKQVQAILDQAAAAKAQHDDSAALLEYRKALQMIRAEKRLAEWEDRVLEKVARAAMDAHQPEAAMRAYTELIQLRKNDCSPEAEWPEQCAEPQQQLGLAHMYSGDFQAALPILRASIANYGWAASRKQLEEFRMIQLTHQAETETLLATALFRTGQRNEALGTLDTAIGQLNQVQLDQNIQAGVRDSARSHMQAAQHIQDLIRSN